MAGHRKAWIIGHRTCLAKSCKTCGELKQRAEYATTTGGYMQSECRACQQKRIYVIQKRNALESLPHARKGYYHWTDTEIKDLTFMVNNGVPYKEIAKHLGRSLYSVYNFVAKYELKEKGNVASE